MQKLTKTQLKIVEAINKNKHFAFVRWIAESANLKCTTVKNHIKKLRLLGYIESKISPIDGIEFFDITEKGELATILSK